MADNPGILAADQGFNFLRPGAVPLTFVAPITGYHKDPDRVRLEKQSDQEGVLVKTRLANRIGQSRNDNNGILIEGWYDLFWKNKLHIIPTDGYNLGNIVTAQQRTVEIYNAGETFDQQQKLNTITENNADGFSFISGPTGVPLYIGAHESFVYVWEVSEDGQPVLNMTLDFGFENGVVLTNFITGNRLVLVDFEPQAAFSEVLEWYTDVMEKANGLEQRVSTRDERTRAFTRSYHLNDEEGVRLESLLWGWLERQVGVPVWEQEINLTSAAAISDTTINTTATADLGFVAGENAVIWTQEGTFEAVTVSTVNATSLDLQAPLLQAWPAGARVFPLKTAYMRDDVQQNLWVGDGLRRFTITYDLTEDVSDASEAGFSTYRTFPVWEDGLTLGAESYMRTIKKNIIRARAGKSNKKFAQSTRREEATSMISGFTMYAEDAAGVRRLRQWLDARRGRQKAFWLPSSKIDMTVAEDAGAPDTLIKVNLIGWDRFIESAPGSRRDIRIEYNDGSIDYRRITGSVPNGATGGEDLTIDSSTSQTFTAANVAKISFMQLVRQDSDTITISHDRKNDIVVNVPLKEVKES